MITTIFPTIYGHFVSPYNHQALDNPSDMLSLQLMSKETTDPSEADLSGDLQHQVSVSTPTQRLECLGKIAFLGATVLVI